MSGLVRGPGEVQIGVYTYAEEGTQVLTWHPDERVAIGKYTSIANDVTILGGGAHLQGVSTFPFEPRMEGGDAYRFYRVGRPVEIGSDCWIGHGAVILEGTTVGHGAIVGAGAVVRTDVPAYGVVIGNPSRLVRYRFDESVRLALLQIAWWDWEPEVVKSRKDWFDLPVQEFIERAGETV
jgi:acetyltransferase-like isoleucine patch superfamily enzyme